jgi:hypothetical protein
MPLLFITHSLDILDYFNLLLQKPSFIVNVQSILFSVSVGMLEFMKTLNKALQKSLTLRNLLKI